MIAGYYMDRNGRRLIDGVPKVQVNVGPHTAMGSSDKPCIELEVAREINAGPHRGQQEEFIIYLVEEDIQRLKEAIKVAEAGQEGTFDIS